MNQDKKRAIIEMRKNKKTYSAIADELGLSINTVKSICYRNNIRSKTSKKSNEPVCKQCGKAITEKSKTRPRLFCCESCKVAWWNANRCCRKSDKIVPYNCSVCGKIFMDYVGANRKYCSQECYRERNDKDG